MSVPYPSDFPIPVWEPPPVRRGRPRAAWCVIGAAVLGIVLARMFLHPKAETTGESARDAAQTMSLRVIGKYLVGGYELSGRTESRYYQFIAAQQTETPEQRLDIAILAGELASPAEALNRLKEAQTQWSNDGTKLSEEQAQVFDILERLYADYAEKRFHAPSVSEKKRELLRRELGWFGDLALTPPEASTTERQAVLAPAYKTVWTLIGIGAAIAILFPIGCVGLLLFLLLALTRFLQGGLQRGSLHGGIYAETFALWLFLFFALGVGTSQIPAGDFQLLVGGLGNFLSLSVLGWPVLRGIPWRQVQKDIGWTSGRAGIAEPFVGVWTYVISLPLVALGMLIVLILMTLVQSLYGGKMPVEPTHPIQEFVNTSNVWQWLQLVFLASVAAPVVEETMFRGVLYRQMRQATSRWGFGWSLLLSMLVVSFVFAVIHPQGLLAVPALMCIAFGLTLTREWRVCLLPSIVQHGVHNGCLVLLLYLFHDLST